MKGWIFFTWQWISRRVGIDIEEARVTLERFKKGACPLLWSSSGDAACSHVRRNGEIHFGRARRASLVHDLDKGRLVDREIQAFVELLLFADGRGHPAVIIVAGIDDRVVRQREEFLPDRVEERLRGAALKIGAAVAPNEQC